MQADPDSAPHFFGELFNGRVQVRAALLRLLLVLCEQSCRAPRDNFSVERKFSSDGATRPLRIA
jgi:hypothetical protein